jgi:2-dehydro-3-deoxygalactonokinase
MLGGDDVASLIGLDWGTTNLRAYLFGDEGHVIDARSSAAGVIAIGGVDRDAGFGNAVTDLCEDWLTEWEQIPMLAAGMVGSTRGWIDAGYRTLPASLDEPPRETCAVAVAGRQLTILPGLRDPGPSHGVMRGEETQLVGLTELLPGDAVVLPGTHSKWVSVVDRVVQSFDTYMTGEVFALLAAQSILSEFATVGEPHPEAFARGVDAAVAQSADLLGAAFSARALVLAGQLAPEQVRDYLSGLVIGCELASPRVATQRGVARGLVVVGADGLADR